MHLLELLVLGWFWATPILYEYMRAATWLDSKGINGDLQLINPATPIVITFQRALYGTSGVGDRRLLPDNGPLWYLGVLAATAAIWACVGYLALRLFDRADVNMAETL
jgi:ABC-2 type transport system permease protein